MDLSKNNEAPKVPRFLQINGGRRLTGCVDIGGSKQGALHILGALLLADGRVTLKNMPDITDVHDFLAIYHSLGVVSRWKENDLILDVHPRGFTPNSLNTSLASRFRSSLLLLGSALVRNGAIDFPNPGGCQLGARSLDRYISIVHRFGFRAFVDGARVRGKVARGFRPSYVEVDLENKGQNSTALALILASGTSGESVLFRPLRAPAIDNLVAFLRLLGVRIDRERDGSETIRVWSPGVEKLKAVAVEHALCPDGPEMTFWLAAAVLTQGRIRLNCLHIEFAKGTLGPLGRIQDNLLNRIGIPVHKINKHSIEVDGAAILPKPVDISTVYDEYEGVAIDCAPHLIPVLACARGRSFYEDIHYGIHRVAFAPELSKLGCEISFAGNGIVIQGSPEFQSASVCGKDIRATACLVLAALRAKGVSYVGGFELVERAYDQLVSKLVDLGGKVEIVSGYDESMPTTSGPTR